MASEHKSRRLPLRRHSLAGPRVPQRRGSKSEDTSSSGKGRSFFKLLMHRSWKQRSVSTPAINTNHSQSPSLLHHHGNSNQGMEPGILVVATVLQPHLHYKRIPITTATTVKDIITRLVSKYAVNEEDKDPGSFYLMESHDREQGSYSRVLTDPEVTVQSVLDRWGSDSGYFTLTRATPPATIATTEPLFSSSPALFSEREGSVMEYHVCVEERGGSQLSQSLNDLSTATTISSHQKKNYSTPPQFTILVSPCSNGASQIKQDQENLSGELPRLQDTGMYSSFSAFSRESSPASPLVIDSPSHQYIITGSTSNRSDDSFHGNEPSGVTHFHFPSANPGSPTESNHGNTVENNNIMVKEEEERERRERVSEMMKMSVESGLGQIMAQVVEEGQRETFKVKAEDEEEDVVGKVEGKEEEENKEKKDEDEEEEEEEKKDNKEEGKEEVEEDEDEKSKMNEIEDTESLTGDEEKLASELNDEIVAEPREVVTMMMTLDSFKQTATAHSLIRMESNLTVSPVVMTTKSFDKPVHPRKGRNRAHLMKSASVAMDTELDVTTEKETVSELTEDLVSPQRRHQMMSAAAKRFKFKRANTFDIGAGSTHQMGAGTHDLVSQARKERLMNEALESMRRRFSQSLTKQPSNSN